MSNGTQWCIIFGIIAVILLIRWGIKLRRIMREYKIPEFRGKRLHNRLADRMRTKKWWKEKLFLAWVMFFLITFFSIPYICGMANDRQWWANEFAKKCDQADIGPIQYVVYCFYDWFNPSPYISEKSVKAYSLQLFKYRSTRAVENIRAAIAHPTEYYDKDGERVIELWKPEVLTDGYILYIQYPRFSEDTFGVPLKLMRRKVLVDSEAVDVCPWLDREIYIKATDGNMYKSHFTSIDRYAEALGFQAIVFRDTQWWDHIIHGRSVHYLGPGH